MSSPAQNIRFHVFEEDILRETIAVMETPEEIVVGWGFRLAWGKHDGGFPHSLAWRRETVLGYVNKSIEEGKAYRYVALGQST